MNTNAKNIRNFRLSFPNAAFSFDYCIDNR